MNDDTPQMNLTPGGEGGYLAFTVTRANGDVEKYVAKNYWNYNYTGWGQGGLRVNLTSQGFFRFMAYSAAAIYPIGGTWQQSGTTLSRVSGTDTLTNTGQQGFIFADGSFSGFWNTGSGTSITVSRSQTKSAQAIWGIHNWQTNSDQARLIESAFFNVNKSYSAGVVVQSYTGTPIVTPLFTSTQTIRTLTIQYTGSTTYAGSLFALSTPIVVNNGDTLTLDSYTATATFEGGGAPIAFTSGNSPIPGFTGSGTIQNLVPHLGTGQGAVVPTRIWLINAANLYTVPNTPQATYINPTGVITAYETITSVGTAVSGMNFPNDMQEFNYIYGAVSVASTTLRQIAWGTATQIFGIITYNTDQTLAADTNIQVSGRLRFKPVYETPPP